MPQAQRLELAGFHLGAHAVEHGHGRAFAIGGDDLGKSGGKGCFGDDFGLDAGGQAFGPRLIVALDGGQALFFPNQGVDVAYALLHCGLSPCPMTR